MHLIVYYFILVGLWLSNMYETKIYIYIYIYIYMCVCVCMWFKIPYGHEYLCRFCANTEYTNIEVCFSDSHTITFLYLITITRVIYEGLDAIILLCIILSTYTEKYFYSNTATSGVTFVWT